eukprot:Sspe_Gene.62347::Locus_34957_Transcript_3_3_Confidence_0.714_Length_4610::g.62347::m.62347
MPSDRAVRWRAVGAEHARGCEDTFTGYLEYAEHELQAECSQIALDVPRTPTDGWDLPGPLDRPLERVLRAWAGRCTLVNPSVLPYVQGMTLLALVPLHVLQLDDEAAFWVFAYLIEECLSPGVFDDTPPLAGHRADTTLFQECCKERLGELKRAVGEDELSGSAALIATKWLLPAYVGALPVESVLSLWDTLLFPQRGQVGLRSAPLLVWGTSVLAALQVQLLTRLDRARRADPDVPVSVLLANLAIAAARDLPSGFVVDWTKVPGWDPVALARRHGALRAKDGGGRWLRHVWRKAEGKVSGLKARGTRKQRTSPPRKNAQPRVHPVFLPDTDTPEPQDEPPEQSTEAATEKEAASPSTPGSFLDIFDTPLTAPHPPHPLDEWLGTVQPQPPPAEAAPATDLLSFLTCDPPSAQSPSPAVKDVLDSFDVSHIMPVPDCPLLPSPSNPLPRAPPPRPWHPEPPLPQNYRCVKSTEPDVFARLWCDANGEA